MKQKLKLPFAPMGPRLNLSEAELAERHRDRLRKDRERKRFYKEGTMVPRKLVPVSKVLEFVTIHGLLEQWTQFIGFQDQDQQEWVDAGEGVYFKNTTVNPQDIKNKSND